MANVEKKKYEAVAGVLNKVLKTRFSSDGFAPRVEAIERGSDGHIILMNEDCHDMADCKGYLQDIFYAGETIVVGDDDFYLEPYSDSMSFKVAR